MIKICARCGKEFIPKPKATKQKYCNDCINATDECPVCGKTKSIWNKYCSLSCSTTASRPILTHICERCGKEYKTQAYSQKYCNDCINATDECPVCGKTKSIWNDYCSLSCSTSATRKTTKYKCKCDACGETFLGNSPISKICDKCSSETTNCVVCGKLIPKYLEGHGATIRSVCSASCAAVLSTKIPRTQEQKHNIIEKTKETNLKRYGSAYYVQTNEFKLRNQKTIQEKYGVNNVMQVPEILEKQRQSNKTNSGYENNFDNPEILERIKQTNIQRYGTEHPIASSDVRAKIITTNLKKHGVEWPSQSKEVQAKIKETQRIRYGDGGGLASDEVRQKIYKTNIEIYGCIYPNQKDYPEYLKKLFNEIYVPTGYDVYKFFKENNLTSYRALKKYDYYYAHILLHIAQHFNIEIEMPPLPAGSSWAEFEILDFLKDNNMNPIHRYKNKNCGEIDIFIPELNFGIEYNGTYWHATENGSKNETPKKYHQEKSINAEKIGIFIYHIFEYDWMNHIKQEIIKSQILNFIHKTPDKIYARKCELRKVNYRDAARFINENHLQGDGNLNKQINYGLYYNNELVYIMTFGKWRRGYKGKIQWEIFRSCSKIYTNVVGGAEKCFKQFLKDYPEGTVGTYSAIQSGTGKLYEKLGFKLEKVTEPSAVRVDKNNQCVYTIFTKQFKEYSDLPLIYGCGNKLWIYRR